ncbi:helix-turn-helix domain-containing protein [Enterococcus cecorum]|uniref:helix-turn-helix domain-containing protein n=1 Tax=Enterococcus cecorum TaxID=44008 RepID=UPI0022DC8651|nr:helix-turn-helix domain-containing protein [Enterococcus cecorum]MDZ5573573.1 DUF4115 domain-containing protein [Enterococcus cecorum]MDZ5577380.1 DUF4115 domain-containing protein [Enterococcus cecorum]MDZ5580132.1 DUF4115 domain-containing protein [Enterococcus cecorum]MDZ5589068.1 DUF4115 domain-containing protein [Enterococcus cecorum]MDZ5600444.1 DUF4115 domain-containing protein [Enterococcus cecorum]
MGNETIIGATLREARLNKKISLDELQQMTKIQKRYLEALEQGAFDRLPGDYYVRTFIRQYAQAVGINGEKLVAAFDGDEDQLLPELPKREQVAEVQNTRTQVHTQMSRRGKQKDYIPIIVLGSIALVILIIVGYTTLQDYKSTSMIEAPSSVEKQASSKSSTSHTSSSSSTSESTKESSTTSTTKEEKNKLEMSVTQLSAAQAQVAINQAKAPITFQFKGVNGPCWVGVMVNGSYLYQYTLQAGIEQTYTLPDQVTQGTIVLGASDNVEIQVNSQKLDFKNPAYKVTKKNLDFIISYQNQGTQANQTTTQAQ